jgi:hypothetical protein
MRVGSRYPCLGYYTTGIFVPQLFRVPSAACPDPVSPGSGGYLKVATPMQRTLHVPNNTINGPRLCKSQNIPGELHIDQYRAGAIGRLNQDPVLTA